MHAPELISALGRPCPFCGPRLPMAFSETDDGARLPFKQAIDFFQRKASVPSSRWTEIWQGEHARAFTIAGATKEALLGDFRDAIQSALTNGDTLTDFQKRFDEIVEKHGWSHTGTAAWRARVIYETNMRTAYAAGRYEQLQAVKDVMPFWEYVHGGSKVPRPEHLAWHGMILLADDPWWATHYPPNGWGCSCRVNALSRRQVRRMGIDPDALVAGRAGVRQADGSMVLGAIPFINDTYVWRSPDGTRSQTLPRGVQPGWAYNVGAAASAPVSTTPATRTQPSTQTAPAPVTIPETRVASSPPQPTPAQPQPAEPETPPVKVVERAPERDWTIPRSPVVQPSVVDTAPEPSTPKPGAYPPSVPLGRGNTRHRSLGIMLGSELKNVNTFALDGVDIDPERELIKQGAVPELVLPTGIRRYEINGRIYEAHPPKPPAVEWPIYPVSGPGLVAISKRVAMALKAIERGHRLDPRELNALNDYDSADVTEAWRIWNTYGRGRP